ncbi:MAG: SEFIR domain-containing protein [Balneola sp.]
MSEIKLFVSYSWTNPDHEDWVLNLATDLVDSGVNVILDKWDLKEGHDANAFMEQMVTDPEIKKVLLISDKGYAKKTDLRAGGVGAEAQIITSEIYSKKGQEKFVAVVKEKDENGKAYLPTYYKSRIYIDLSDISVYAENFERLIRWIFDQPLYIKPELGDKPKFLTSEEGEFRLATSIKFKRAINSLKKGEEFANATVEEYLNTLSGEFQKIRIDTHNEFDEEVIRSIDQFLPYRNEAIELFATITLYQISDENLNSLHRFFEKLIPYLDRTKEISSYKEWDFDNFRFIIHELFLYLIAILIKYKKFVAANYFLTNEYYIIENTEQGLEPMVSFSEIRRYMKSLDYRNERLKLNRLSIRADLLKSRNSDSGVDFRYLMEADFVLYMREEIENGDSYSGGWWPETLLNIGYQRMPFEIFARSKSMEFFNKAKVLLGIENKDELKLIIDEFKTGKRKAPRWQHRGINPEVLLGFDQLGSVP